LKPGTVYTAQVRALSGSTGQSDWNDRHRTWRYKSEGGLPSSRTGFSFRWIDKSNPGAPGSSAVLLYKCRLMNSNLRAAVISEWRGLPEKKTRPDRFQSAGDLLPKLFQRLGLRERLHETEVIDAWAKIVGEFIAVHSAPLALREGILRPLAGALLRT
jgi:hypothetical protein